MGSRFTEGKRERQGLFHPSAFILHPSSLFIEEIMAILIDQTKRVLVQGITGREGMARAKLMTEYGTQVVAGVTPGRGGERVEGVPVYDTVLEAWEQVGPIDVSVLFIPAPLVKSAALEAIDAGVKLLVIVQIGRAHV